MSAKKPGANLKPYMNFMAKYRNYSNNPPGKSPLSDGRGAFKNQFSRA